MAPTEEIVARDDDSDVDDAPQDFDTFFRTYFPGVARAAALVARDPSTGQDLAQEAFARLYQRWHDMTSSEHARNFVYRVAINLARSHLRKHLRLSPFGSTPSYEPATSDPSARSDDWLLIADALAALPPRQRACVVLVDYSDMDAASAAKALGMGTGTVRVHLMRGRRALRRVPGVVARRSLDRVRERPRCDAGPDRCQRHERRRHRYLPLHDAQRRQPGDQGPRRRRSGDLADLLEDLTDRAPIRARRS
jgi:RNA polymerase sigma factor (sigma-70 family)